MNGANATIEIRIEEISQLFDTLDPFPFRERDLDKSAEEYIVGWARELPRDRPIRIVVHLAKPATSPIGARELGDALRHFFEYRSEVVTRDLHELFRVGRQALAIGLAVLAACLVAWQAIAGELGTGGVARFVEESLIIVGWVANWRPIEIFLYEWWPLARRRNLYPRLAAAIVEVKPYEGS
jgi:hypothetical protein